MNVKYTRSKTLVTSSVIIVQEEGHVGQSGREGGGEEDGKHLCACV